MKTETRLKQTKQGVTLRLTWLEFAALREMVNEANGDFDYTDSLIEQKADKKKIDAASNVCRALLY